jgi:energy-coupling factor transporter ATP-binding protein EcfA2
MAPLMIRPPKVLIADEPTLGLAPRISAQIITMFEELKHRGLTLLIVEERAKSVLEIADSVVLLELGRVVWAGARPELDQGRLTAVYLGQAAMPSEAAMPSDGGVTSGPLSKTTQLSRTSQLSKTRTPRRFRPARISA